MADSLSQTAEIATPSIPKATVKVLHVINGEHYAGAERVQDLLALNLSSFGYEVGFACVKLDQFDVQRQAKDAPLYDFSMRHRLDFIAGMRIAEVVRKEGYKLIHAHTSRSAIVGCLAASMTKVPMVYHVHSPTTRNTTRQLLNRMNYWVEKLCLRRAHRLIAVSASLKQYMIDLGFAEESIDVVYNGVPSQKELPVRSRPQDTWTLGTVALFRPRKGLEVLIEALAMLRQEKRPVRLRAVGTFESETYQKEILALAEQRGVADAIEWTGFCRDVTAELHQMDVMVLPSLFGEGMPMVVLEAMAAGVPVVATKVEGVPEAIRHGVDGIITEPGDPQSLAAGIESLLDGVFDWSVLRESAFERQRREFSDRSMAAGVAAVYDKILN